MAASASSNRLSAGFYDAAGNLVAWGSGRYRWDALDALTHSDFPRKMHLYTASGERVLSFDYQGDLETLRWDYTLRDLNGQLLTHIELVGAYHEGTWRRKRDYVYRGPILLAADTDEGWPTQRQHFYPDHLGTPRLVAAQNGSLLGAKHYFGFGERAGGNPPDDLEKLQFTGHERDLAGGGTTHDLDYMHARYYSPHLGRFLSVDPANDTNPVVPQSWNRYAYARGNPLKYVDPDGQAIETAWDLGNVVLGAASLVQNVRQGNLGAAILDAGGVVLDAAAAAVPFAPGGASTAIKTARAAGKAKDAARAADKAKDAGRRVNKVRAAEGAGPHTGFKRDPNTGKVTGYTEFNEAGTPVKRFRQEGKTHGGVNPPLVLEPKAGKGPGAPLQRARPARQNEIPEAD